MAGDLTCQRRFVDTFQGMIFGMCLRMLTDRHEAEDLTQEVFLRAFRNLHRWDGIRPLRPWLLTIAANRCRTRLDERSRRGVPIEIDANRLPARAASGEPSDDAEEIQRAVAALRPDYQQVFVLFYQQELSVKEIADVLDCPEGTVKIWLHRARKEICETLRGRGFGRSE